MENEEKAKVILDYDKYQELLERARFSDLKARSIEDAAFDKVTKECEKCVNELREKIASLERRCVTISICIIMGMIAGLALCLAE